MRHFLCYRTNMLVVTDFLNKHLFSYNNFVNVDECARYLVYDFFAAKFDTPYKYYSFNNCLVFLKPGAEKLLSGKDLEFVARTLWSSFWPMQRYLTDILAHCGASAMPHKPTDCYFNYIGSEDLEIYVPIISTDRIPQQQGYPEVALQFTTKAGTA